jgi:hypothetical protein
LSDLLTSSRTSIRNVASIIVITPSNDPQWLEAILPLAHRGVVPTVLLLDPTSFGSIRDIKQMATTLTELNIARYVVTQEWLNKPEAHPGEIKWHISATGRARATQPADQIPWHGEQRFR